MTIFGVTPAGYNGTYVVTSVPAANMFTVSTPASNLGAGTAFGSVGVAITEGNLLSGTTLGNTARALTKSGPGQLTISGGGTGWGLGAGLLGQLQIVGGTVVCNNNGIVGPGSSTINGNPSQTDVRIESNCGLVLDYSNAQIIPGVGTVTTTGTTTVTGSGSFFQNQFLPGDMLFITGQTQPQIVVSATSPTALTTVIAFPTISTPQSFNIVRGKASLRDSYGLNGTNSLFQIKGNSTTNTLTMVTNFVNGNGLGIVKLSNAAGSTVGAGDANFQVRTNMYSNNGINDALTGNNVNGTTFSLFTNGNPYSTNNSSSPLSFVRDSSSGGAGSTLFQVAFGAPPPDNMPIPWMKISTLTTSAATTSLNQSVKYTGPNVTKQGFVPLTSGTVYTSLASGNWSTATNWTPAGVPAAGDQAIINANHVIDLQAGTQAVATLTFNQGGGLVSTGGAATLTLGSGTSPALIQTLYSYANPSIASTVNLTLGANLQVDTSNFGALTINGPLSGAFSLTKTGIGELILTNGASNYSGGTFFGMLATSQNLPGGKLTLGADTTVNGSNVVQSGPIGTGTLTWNCALSTTTYPISVLQATGTGSPRLIANPMTTAATANYIMAIGGTKDIAFSGNLVLTANSILQIANTRTVFQSPGVISGAFSLVKSGPGTLALSGANTFTGGFTLGVINPQSNNGTGFGTLELMADSTNSNPPTSGPLGTGTFTILQFNTGSPVTMLNPSIVASGTGARTITNTLALNGNFNVLPGNDLNLGFTGVNAALGSTRVITVSNTNTTIKGNITGANLGLDKDGTGTLFLPGVNTYSGPTTVNNGVLSLPTDTGRLTATTAITVNAGATFDISNLSGSNTGATNVDHLFNAASLNLNGGTFQIVPPNASISQVETIGQVNVFAASTINLNGTNVTNTGVNVQLVSNSFGGNFNFNGGTLNFIRVAPVGGGATNLFLSPSPVARFDVPQANVNGRFAEYDIANGPEGLRAKISGNAGAPFISQTSSDNKWNNTATWVNGVVPTSSSDVTIRSAVIADQATQSCNSLSFDQAVGSISGTAVNVLTIGGNMAGTTGVIDVGASASPTITCGLSFGLATGFINNNATTASSLSISGPITSSSTGGLTVGGTGQTNLSGTLSFSGGLNVVGGNTVLSAINTYTGGTVVSSGLLNISNDNNLGAVSGPVTVQGAVPATQLNGPAQSVAPTMVSGAGTITTPGSVLTTAALPAGTSTTTVAVASVPFAIAANTAITISNGNSIQVVQVPGAVGVAAGATNITVTAFVPSVTFPIGSSVNVAKNVTGASTFFTQQVQVGDTIICGLGAAVVAAITDDTHLLVGTPLPSITTGTGFTVLHGAGVVGSGTIANASTFNGYGTSTTTAGSAVVNGTGTNYIAQLLPGDTVTIGSNSMQVSAVNGPTQFTATTGTGVTAVSNSAYVVGRSNLYAGTGTLFSNAGIGTITTAASTTVTGIGTSFTKQLTVGQLVVVNGVQNAILVASIQSDTQFTTTANPSQVVTQQTFTIGAPGYNTGGGGTTTAIQASAVAGVGDQIIANGQIATINNVPNPYNLSTTASTLALSAGTSYPYLIVRPQGVTPQPASATITGLAMTYGFAGTGTLNLVAGSATVNQNGATNFIQQLLPGDIINVGGNVGSDIINANGNLIVVQSVVSAAQFIATAPVGFSATNQSYIIQRPNVIGVNTNFTKTVNVGDYIYAGGQVQQVAVIFDDTHLTTVLGFNPPLPPGTPLSTLRTIAAQGTVFAVNSGTVIGSGTNFLSQVAVGDFIYISNSSVQMVTAITDDTHLTTANGFGNNAVSMNAPYTILRGSAVGGGTLSVTSSDVLLNPSRGFIIGPQGGSVFVGSNLTLTVNSALIGNNPLTKNGPGRFTLANGNIVAASTSQRVACTFVNAGQLRYGTGNALGQVTTSAGATANTIGGTGILIVQSGATLEVGPTISTGNSQNVLMASGSTLAGFGNCTENFNTIILPAYGTLTMTHQLINVGDAFTTNGFNGNNALSFGGSNNPANTIVNVNAGNGRIIINAGGGFEGRWFVNSGICQANGNNVFGDNSPEPSYVYVNTGGTLALNGDLNTPIVLQGGTLGMVGNNRQLQAVNGNVTNGPIGSANFPILTIASPSTITTDDVVNPGSARGLYVNGILAGTQPINMLSTLPTGFIDLDSPNNTYSGTITVNSYGQLTAQGAGTLGQVGNPATVQLKGGNLQIQSNVGVNFPCNVIVANSDVPGVFSQIQVQDNTTTGSVFFPDQILQNQVITLSSLTMGSQNLVVIGRNYEAQFNYQLGFSSATFTGTPTFNTLSALLRFDNPISGNNGITKYGAMPLQLNAANTYSGPTTVNFGQIILNGPNSAVGGDVVVNSGGEFTISSNVLSATNSIPDGSSIKLNGGIFTLQASPNATHTEAVGSLVLGTGTSTLNLTPNGTGGAQLSVGTISVNPGANLTLNRSFTASGNANLLVGTPVTNYFDITVVEPTVAARGVYHTNAQPDLGVVAFQGSGTVGTGPFVYYSLASGNWDDTTKWRSVPTGGTFPQGTDDAIINAGHIMDLHGANQAANSIAFAPTLSPLGSFVATATGIGTSNTAITSLLVNAASPVGRKVTVLTNFGTALGQTSTISFFNPITGQITLNPPLTTGIIYNADVFRIDYQVNGNITAAGFTATGLAPFGGSTSSLIGQSIIFTSGNALGQASVITGVSSSGVVAFAANLPIAPAAGDTFIVGGSTVSGAVTTTGGTTTFTATSLISSAGLFSNLAGCQILFTSGTNAGQAAQITSVNTVGLVTYSPATTATAAVGNTFVILANQNNGISNVNGNPSSAVSQAAALSVTSGVVQVLQPGGVSGQGMGWKGEYYNSQNFTNLTMTRIDPTIYNPNLTIDPDGPGGPLGTTNLTMVWSGFIIPDFTEDYTFTFRQDDAVRVFINGQLVVDGWNLGGIQAIAPYGTVSLTAGVKYAVRVEYAQQGGGSSWDLQWNSTNQTAGVNAVIPTANVIPASANTVINCVLNFGANTGKLTNNGGGTLVVNGQIQGTNGVQMAANGAIALNGANAYTNGTTLGSGFIQLGGNSALGAGTVTVGRNVTLMGALEFNNQSAVISNNLNIPDDFYIGNSPNQLTFSGNLLMQNGSRTITFNNNVTRNPGGITGSVVNITGTISDGNNGYAFIKNGYGNVQFSSQPTQAYTGPTVVARGTLLLGSDNALAPTGSIVMAGAPTGTPNATNTNSVYVAFLNLNGFNQTTTSLTMGFNPYIDQIAQSGFSVVTSGFGGTGGGNLTINNSSFVRYDGVIQGSLNVVKNGTGTFVLGGGNSYQGQTIVNAGTLAYGINNTIPSASSVIINANGILDLNGTTSQIGKNTGSGASINTVGSGSSLQINNGAVVNSAPSGFLLLYADVYATGTLGHIDGQLQFGNNWTEQMFVNNASDVLTINAALNGTLINSNNQNNAGIPTPIISKMGKGTVLLNSGESNYPGSILVNQGTFQMNGATAALINAVGVTLNGGTFLIDSTVGGSGLNHLNDQVALTFNGGAFTMAAPAGTVRNEIVGQINFAGGNSLITLTPNGSSSSILTANTFTRVNGATFQFNRTNAAGGGFDPGHLYFANPAPLTNNGAVPFGLVNDGPVTGTKYVQAIYTVANGIIEGTLPGTLYISNGGGGGSWESAATWTVASGSSNLGYPSGLNGERVRIIGTDSVTINQAETIDQVEFADNGATPSNGTLTGGFNLTISAASSPIQSLNQIYVSGTGAPTLSTTGLVVNGAFLINNQSSALPGLTISSAISNATTTPDLPLVWYKFDEGTLGTPVTGNTGSNPVMTVTNSGSLGATANGIIYSGQAVPASTIAASGATETAGNVATITTTAAHNLVIGQQIVIAGNSTSAFNGTFNIVTVPSATTFTFANPTANTTTGSGGTVTSTSGAPSYVTGAVGTGALSFNGGIITGGGASATVNGVQSAGYVDVPNFYLPAGSPVTVSFWFQLPVAFSATANANRAQFNFGVGANPLTNGQINLPYNRFSGNTPWQDGNTYFDYGGQTNFQDRVQITGNTNNLYSTPNTWIHCVMIAGGASSPFRAIYMNGQLYASHYFGSSGPQVALERLIIGCSPENLGFNMFQGSMDDFRIYNRVLGVGEIAQLAAKQDPVSTSITKTGGGTVVFTGTNSFTVPLNIDAGVLSVSNTVNLNSSAATPPQIGLNGGTLLATANLTTPLAQTYSIAAPSMNTSVDAANGVTFAIQGPMSGGSMAVNAQASSTGTVFIQSNAYLGTGTVSVAANSTAVVGDANTTFLSQVKVGDQFCSGGFAQNVVAIGSNSSLTLGANLGAQTVLAGNSYMIVRPVPRSGQTFVNNGTLRVPTLPVGNAVGTTIGNSQAFVNNGATLELFTPTVASPANAAITCTQNATAVTGNANTNFGGAGDVAVGDTIASLDNNGNLATALVSAVGGTSSLTVGAGFNNTAGLTNRPYTIVKGPAGYFFGSPIFLNDGATLLGSGNMPIASLGSGAGGGTASTVTVAQGASVTIKTRDATNTSQTAPAVADVFRLGTAVDQLRGGGGLVSIPGAGTVSSSGLAITGSGGFSGLVRLGDLLTVNGVSRMVINANSDVSLTVASPFPSPLTNASYTLVRTSSVVYGGAGRVQFQQDNNGLYYTGNHIVNSSPVNNITLTNETGGPSGISSPTISSMLLFFNNGNNFSVQQNTILVNSGTLGGNGGSINCPLILNGGGISGNNNTTVYNASVNIASNSYFLYSSFNSLNGSQSQIVGPVSGAGQLTLYAPPPIGTTGAGNINFYFQNPNNTYTGTVVANSPSISTALQSANPESPATMALPCTIQLGYTQQLYLRSDTATHYSTNVQYITGTTATQSSINTIQELAANNGTVTVTTITPHNLTANNSFITISGVTPSQYNGTFLITGVTVPFTFTYTCPTQNLAAGSGGTVTLNSTRIDTGSFGGSIPLVEYLNNLTIGSNQTVILNINGNQNQGVGFSSVTLTGPVNPAVPTFYNNNASTAYAPNPIELAGPVSDGGNGYGYMKFGTGLLLVSNNTSTYSGDTDIFSGTVRAGIGNPFPFGAGKGNLVLGGTVISTIGVGALDMNSFNVNLNGLSGGGTIDTSTANGVSVANPLLLTIGNGNATGTVFGGIIQNTVGSIELVKTGSGSLQVSGNNTYSGTTRVNQGTLLYGGIAGTALVNIASGATLKATAGPGLNGQYYYNPLITGYNNNAVYPGPYGAADPDYASLSTFNAHLATLTPYLTANTTLAGANMDFGVGGATFPPGYNSSPGGTNNFEARWTGLIYIATAGVYSFATNSDDGSMLWIDGTLVANNDVFQGTGNIRGGSITLSSGYHNIVVGYYEGNGGFGMQVLFQSRRNSPRCRTISTQ